MSEEELERIIEKARIDRSPVLDLSENELNNLPKSIGNLPNLIRLNLRENKISSLPESITNLSKLTYLNLSTNQLINLPKNIGNLSNLTHLYLLENQLCSLPQSICDLSSLKYLYLNGNRFSSLAECGHNKFYSLITLGLSDNQFTSLPEWIGQIPSLTQLNLSGNQLTELPRWISNISNLSLINPDNNPLMDLSVLQTLPKLSLVEFFGVDLPRRYWTNFSKWEPDWLLDEKNVEIRRALIQQVGYEAICHKLDVTELNIWREYSLLLIDNAESFYNEDTDEEITEPMVLLKMTCPSTRHIHILRVPPEMTSAEAAITWVNHGIHPDEFAVQT